MSTYQIITDSACDLPATMLAQLDVQITPLHVLFRGENLPDSVDDGLKEIYDGLRTGEATSTSAVNPEGWAAVIEPALAAGRPGLFLRPEHHLPIRCHCRRGSVRKVSGPQGDGCGHRLRRAGAGTFRIPYLQNAG